MKPKEVFDKIFGSFMFFVGLEGVKVSGSLSEIQFLMIMSYLCFSLTMIVGFYFFFRDLLNK